MKNILFAVPIVLSSIISGCEKTIPPETTSLNAHIISPLNNKMYDDNILPIKWYSEGNIKSVGCSVNDGEIFPLDSKTGSLNWYFGNGNNKLVLIVEDYTHTVKDSVQFCAGKFIK